METGYVIHNILCKEKSEEENIVKAKLNPLVLGVSGAIVAVAVMLLLGILGNFGIYEGAVDMMMKWHMFFSLSPLGIVGGMIEAAVISFVLLYLFAIIYNKFVG